MAHALALAPQVLQAAAVLERRRRACAGSFTAFTRAIARDQDGLALDMWPGHLQWHHHVAYCWAHGLRCMILAPFGHGKSSSLAVPLVAYLIGHDVQRRVKIISNSDDQAKQRVYSVKLLMESPGYKWAFPHVLVGTKWTDHQLYVRRAGAGMDPTVHARGVLTKGLGGRADVMIFDDVCDPNNTAEAAQRRKIRNLVDQTWLTRLDRKNGGQEPLVLWIATPWHVDDATHGLMGTPGWCTLIQKVNQDCTLVEQEVVGLLDGVPYRDGDRVITP